ncbi:MAG: hypothetical protein CMJ89_16840 [Planctomycetes bacterium]|nr:hypothetical protein [Planctomycetota bacterium]
MPTARLELFEKTAHWPAPILNDAMTLFDLRSLLLAGSLLLATSTASLDAQEEKLEEFANAHLLVQTDWLHQHMGDVGLCVVDVRSARDYASGHIPGARNLPTEETFASKGPKGQIGSVEQLGKLFGARGIDDNVRIILYDEGRSTAAARVFWTLEVHGHRNVSVVDGGFAKWKAQERAITRDRPKPTPAIYKVGQPSKALATMEAVLEDVGDPDAIMLDSRSKREFKRGRIPQAVHIEWTENYTSGDPSIFRTPQELKLLYTSAGVTPDKRVHAY